MTTKEIADQLVALCRAGKNIEAVETLLSADVVSVEAMGDETMPAVMTGRDVLYIVEERAPRRPARVTDVGVRLPAHLTATGRAMLAALPREQVRALYPDAASFADRMSGSLTISMSGTPARLRSIAVAPGYRS